MYSLFVWLLSLNTSVFRLIHIVAWMNDSFLFTSEEHSIVYMNHVCLSIHQLMDILFVYTFWFLQ